MKITNITGTRFNFIKLTAVTCSVAGILHGILDIIARSVVWNSISADNDLGGIRGLNLIKE